MSTMELYVSIAVPAFIYISVIVVLVVVAVVVNVLVEVIWSQKLHIGTSHRLSVTHSRMLLRLTGSVDGAAEI